MSRSSTPLAADDGSAPLDAAGWRALAVSHERRQAYEPAFAAYEQALRLSPEPAAVAVDLGRMAHRLGLLAEAAEFLTLYRSVRPDCLDGVNMLACVLRDQHRYDEAVELLRTEIRARPAEPSLWTTLGTVLAARGEPAVALAFFAEALRLDPGAVAARYDLACAQADVDDMDGALENSRLALQAASDPGERAVMRFARATMLLGAGRLEEGWEAYEARLDPDLADAPVFAIGAPRWRPGQPLPAALLVVAEQGVGDEVMFGGMITDLLRDVPDVALAVEPRLVGLFQRAFPQLRVLAHATRREGGRRRRWVPDEPAVQAWTPLASLARLYRRAPADFPGRPAYLAAAEARVSRWRGWLDALPGRKAGLLWRGGKLDGARAREYCPLEQWAPVLRTPGVSFVCLQYGECDAELEEARRAGVRLVLPPGVDLREDLEEVAALASALGHVVGPFNATTNLAAACGAEVWFVAARRSWAQLGAQGFPWHPRARVFLAGGDWDRAMAALAEAMAPSAA